MHEKLSHRGFYAVNYELKVKFVWPDMRNVILKLLKTCSFCNVNKGRKVEV